MNIEDIKKIMILNITMNLRRLPCSDYYIILDYLNLLDYNINSSNIYQSESKIQKMFEKSHYNPQRLTLIFFMIYNEDKHFFNSQLHLIK